MLVSIQHSTVDLTCVEIWASLKVNPNKYNFHTHNGLWLKIVFADFLAFCITRSHLIRLIPVCQYITDRRTLLPYCSQLLSFKRNRVHTFAGTIHRHSPVYSSHNSAYKTLVHTCYNSCLPEHYLPINQKCIFNHWLNQLERM